MKRNLTRKNGFKVAALLVAVLALAGLVACSGGSSSSGSSSGSGSSASATASSSTTSSTSTSSAADQKAPETIVIACLAREEPDVLFVAEKLKDKYNIVSQVFSDNNAINEATLDGSVMLNYFQNVPYLKSWNEARGTDLQYYRDGIIYTRDIVVAHNAKSIDEIPSGAKGLVANDAANQGRELKLLAQTGLIKVKDVDLPTIYDITDNPKNIEIVEVDPRSRAGAFPDVEFMVAPSITVYQMNDPNVKVSDALASETKDVFASTGGTGFVVTKALADENPQWLQDIYAEFQSDEFGDFVEKTYDGAKIPNVYLSKYE
ncbi:MAG: hypothetical protein J6S36_05870 [Eggerthellaceae bacterium]|nr:hypothetical protein [Eggerthellaceae bacterium]